MQNRLNIFPANTVLAGLVLLLTSLATGAQDFESATAAQSLAQQAEAETLAPKIYASALKSLERAIRLATQDRNPGQVTAAFRDATEEFDTAELEAIGNRLLSSARTAIKDADGQRAKRYAPKTLAKARELLTLAEAALKTDRYATEAVEELANQATITARHAIQIATVVRDKPKLEDLILEWETYMARIQAAAGIDIPLDIKADVATDELETMVISLREKELQLRLDLADSQAFVAALEDEIRELDEQLGGASAERHQLVLQLENQARVEEQLAQTEALFLPSEAIVFRQSNTIVVRLFGLEFASGSAKLDENHAALLAKIEQAIGIYPDSSLKIEGHTDSQGSSRLNQRLSQNRAEAVLNYIVTTMHITSQRISAAGYGASQPIANNETKEGRAKNRRIDLLITPAG